MSTKIFRVILMLLGGIFAITFSAICLPEFFRNPNIVEAFAAGFVNPFASGYALDAIFCWLVLISWVVYEARELGVRHGWVCVVLGAVPGAAVGFAAYLLLRLQQQQGGEFNHQVRHSSALE